MKIEEAIQQKSFDNAYIKAHINILYTSSWMLLKVNYWLKPFGLSQQQFNVMRILKGSSPYPLSVRQISERMIDRMSNVTRLIDKLVSKKLVEKKEDEFDKRKLKIALTDYGISLLEMASEVVMDELDKTMKSLEPEEAETLNQLLDKLRSNEKKP